MPFEWTHLWSWSLLFLYSGSKAFQFLWTINAARCTFFKNNYRWIKKDLVIMREQRLRKAHERFAWFHRTSGAAVPVHYRDCLMWPNIFVNEMDVLDLWYLKFLKPWIKLKFLRDNWAKLSFRCTEPNEQSWKETIGSPSFILARMQHLQWPFLQM